MNDNLFPASILLFNVLLIPATTTMTTMTSTMKSPRDTSAAIDATNEYGPPVDYSFKRLTSFLGKFEVVHIIFLNNQVVHQYIQQCQRWFNVLNFNFKIFKFPDP